MSKKRARNHCTNVQGWSKVMEDADIALRNAKARVRAIKKAILAVRKKIDSGEPFPEFLESTSTQT